MLAPACSNRSTTGTLTDSSEDFLGAVFSEIELLVGGHVSNGSVDGTGFQAKFDTPMGLYVDSGNLYIADSSNSTIRRIVLSTSAVSTLAGTAGVPGTTDATGTVARFGQVNRVVSDGTNLYVADTNNCTIRQIVIATGVVTTLAGDSTSCGSSDGTGASAQFTNPYGLVIDSGNLYVADSGTHTIRQIVISTGVVTTFAGSDMTAGDSDGIGIAAEFNGPRGLATDGTNLYVADTDNHLIRQIVIATGDVTTLAGNTGVSGETDDTGTAAEFNSPYDLVVDSGNLYVADSTNSKIRHIVISTGVVTTFAGDGTDAFLNGTGIAAQFNNPQGIASDGTNLYISDTGNNVIRRIVIATGVTTSIAGSPLWQGSTDATGAAAKFDEPQSMVSDGTNLYITDTANATIRKVVISTGVTTTFAGTVGVTGSTDATGTAATFDTPRGITTDGTNLYVADAGNAVIRKIVIATGVVSTFAGTAGVTGVADGTGAAAEFFLPVGITTDGTHLYVADAWNFNIRKIVIATGVVTTLAGSITTVAGDADGTGTAATFRDPNGITTDGTNLFVTDLTSHTIRKIVIATGVVTTFAGTVGASGDSNGTGIAASFSAPRGITNDGVYLYVSDRNNNSIRKIQIADGVVTTLVGTSATTGPELGDQDEEYADARLVNPVGISYHADTERLFVSNNFCIRLIQ